MMSTPNPPVLGEPTVNVVLHMQQGTGTGGATHPPDPNGNLNWVRAKAKDDQGNWTVDSQWWFYYSGGNGQNAGRGGTDGGEIDMPKENGGCFSIGPSGNEVITQVHIHESGTGSNYAPNPPTANDAGVYVISDAAHSDPAGTTDSFDVYARFSAASDEVKCDPIIRNK